MPTAIAIVAHPDDIEFNIAGTLLLLEQAGWETHYLTIANGSLGSRQYTAAQTRIIRRKEAQAAALFLGAHWHPSLVDDLEIFYELSLLRRVTAIIRDVKPTIILTHPPHDYMEDHTNTCRLVVSGAFCRGAPNLKTMPPRRAVTGDVTIYHCMPHGLRDQLRRRVLPEFFVNTTRVHAQKREALSLHVSQTDWLKSSQDTGDLLSTMERYSGELGRQSRRFKHAEGWRRHSHLGFCKENADPLRDALGREVAFNPDFVRLRKEEHYYE